MTVAATTNRKTYTGDNVTTSFATSPVIFYATSDLQVRVTVIATGVSTLLTLNTHYTVSGGSAAGATGTVSLAGGSSPHGALLSTEKLVILRVLPLTQGVDLVNNNNSDAEVLETALDKLTDVDQQIQEQADRAIRFASGDVSGSVTEIPDVTTRSGRLLGFDAAGLLTTFIVQVGTSLANLAASTGSSLIGFIQAGVGAVLRTVQAKLRDTVSVKDFGAVGDGVTNDAGAFQAAITALAASTSASFGAALYVPQGNYLLTTTITIPSALSHLRIYGDGMWASRITASGAIVLFTATNTFTNLSAEDVGFFSGTKAWAIGTANVDETMLNFVRCAIYSQTSIGVDIQSGSNSTQAYFSECVFHGAATFVSSYADYTKIDRCWVFASGAPPCFIAHGAIEVDSMLGVPSAGYDNTQSCWIQSWSHVDCRGSRFGSEDAAGRPVFWQKAAGSAIIVRIEDCYVPCADYHYKFDEVPEHFILKGNKGYGALGGVGGKGIWFKSTSTTNKSFMERGTWIIDDMDFPNTGYFVDDGTNTAAMCELAYAKFATNFPQRLSNQVLLADALISLMSDVRPVDVTNTNVTVGTGAYPLLGGFTAKKLTCTANPGTYIGNNDLVTGTTNAGVNTGVFDFHVAGATRPFWLELQFQKGFHRRLVYNGLNVVCFQFQPDSADANQIVNFLNIPNAAVILIGRMRTFKGAKDIRTVETIYSDLSGGTIPNTAYIYHAKGDRYIYANPAASGVEGQICTTAGQPGTFKNMGVIAA